MKHVRDLCSAAWRILFPVDDAQPASLLHIVNARTNRVVAFAGERAGTGKTRRRGLLGRTTLPAGEALWIVPCEAVHTFRMHFNIDVVYLDRNKKVVKLVHDMCPGRMSACFAAHSVLELPAGTILQTGTERGDVLEFVTVPLGAAALQ